MKNTIKIITDEFSIEGSFSGKISLINPDYDFGGFLKVWDKTKSKEEQFNQICEYFFPDFMRNGHWIDNLNSFDGQRNDELFQLIEKLNKEYFLFLKKVGVPLPRLKYLGDNLDNFWFVISVDTLGMILECIYNCLNDKNIFYLYDVFFDDWDEDYIDYSLVENKFFKVLTI